MCRPRHPGVCTDQGPFGMSLICPSRKYQGLWRSSRNGYGREVGEHQLERISESEWIPHVLIGIISLECPVPSRCTHVWSDADKSPVWNRKNMLPRAIYTTTFTGYSFAAQKERCIQGEHMSRFVTWMHGKLGCCETSSASCMI